MDIFITVVLIVLSYLAGSVSSAIVVCKVMGLPDPRSEGSGNPGATNVLRLGGKKAAFITLLGDMLKGFIPAFIGHYVVKQGDIGLALIGLAAFAGHLLPVFFGFKGGKGVATALGVLLGWYWPAFVLTGITWLAVAFLTRYSSLSALVAFILAPVYAWFFVDSYTLPVATAFMTLVLLARHSKNIRNLIAGVEGRIGDSRAKNSVKEESDDKEESDKDVIAEDETSEKVALEVDEGHKAE